MKEQIIECISELLNGDLQNPRLSDYTNTASVLDQFMLSTAKRLEQGIQKFHLDQIEEVDLMVLLRNYLLVLNARHQVCEVYFEMTQRYAQRFGFLYDKDQYLYATIGLEDFYSDSHFEQAFMREVSTPNNNGGYFLGTNPYVNRLTGFSKYKTIEQKIAVSGALKTPHGYTTLVALPTGGGKSLITQTIAYQEEPSLTVVIVPTVSLALDQHRVARINIREAKEDEILVYYGGLNPQKTLNLLTAIRDERARLLFISPEAIIKNKKIGEALDNAARNQYLKNIVIDEAHIVIEWGSSFRVDYLFIEAWRKKLFAFNSKLRTFLLSATFERKTVMNLKRLFSEEKWIEIRCDALRKEPRFVFVHANSNSEKKAKYLDLIDKLPRPLIVYVLSPSDAEDLKNELINRGYLNVATFTGNTDSAQREEIIRQWSGDEFDIVIATTAFGVGVDKPDVRSVLHLYVPENANKYYQELGRGGRDGLPGLSVLCINRKVDLLKAHHLVDKVLSPEKILGRWFSMYHSPDAERSMDSVLLDTTTKPRYSENVKHKEEHYINKADMNWNIYVIFLLRRYEALEILDMIYKHDVGKYFVNVKIKSTSLYVESEESRKAIERMHEVEKNQNLRDYELIKSSIYNVSIQCWSEMFEATYDKVDEYCAGCFFHERPVNIAIEHFPLKKKLNAIVEQHENIDASFFRGSSEMLVNLDFEKDNVVSLLSALKVDTLVLADRMTGLNDSFRGADHILKTLVVMGEKEFTELVENGSGYWLSRNTMIIYDGEQGDNTLFRAARRLVISGEGKVVHVVRRSWTASSFSEYINGPHYDSHIFKSRR